MGRSVSTDERPLRADARRNRDLLMTAARETFAEKGADAALEDIARRAGVGVGTLYRHFPNRQALLEAVYVDEVESLCRSAADLADREPWDALVQWLDRFVEYVQAKHALAGELLKSLSRDADVFRACHDAIWAAGEPLLDRAREAGAVRSDVAFADVVSLVSGIAMIQWRTPEEIRHVLGVALDGLRYRG